MPDLLLTIKNKRHRDALLWFAQQAGQEVSWPRPLDGMHLVNRAKGIHKPKELAYALSVRNSKMGPYEDAIEFQGSGFWSLRYAYERGSPNSFTNRGLRACLNDSIPIGVIRQVKKKPNPRYQILGLGAVVDDDGQSFKIERLDATLPRSVSAGDVEFLVEDFDSTRMADARDRVVREITARQGQQEFRQNLLEAYGGQCAISGCRVAAVLEAAHIIPYSGSHTNHVQNGMLLRADLHTLFDLGLLSVDPDALIVRVARELQGSDYWQYHAQELMKPLEKVHWPSSEALRRRLNGTN
jgi:putative restriction endonuclease